VTAETVMVLPLLVAVAVGLAWLLSLAATEVRVVDAAREVARASARQETSGTAVALGHRVAPRGSAIAVRSSGDTVVATVRCRVRGPRGLFGFLPEVPVSARAVAAKEPT
jgi:Flp pilus assembly protein TadG